jgi:malonyl CoA-acyl carrier protein transacylase
MKTKSAFLFPAFITDYTQKELEVLSNNGIDFNSYIKVASDKLGVILPDFSYQSEEYRNDELLAQIIAYLFSCAFSDLLKKKHIKPSFAAGYSMGIYASLYSAGSISISDGIQIIYKAFELVNELACKGEYSMGGIIGLSRNDIDEIINKSNADVEVINSNSEFSHVIAGIKTHVLQTLDLARNEGALNVTPLNVKTPYHSRFLNVFAERFMSFIDTIDLKTPHFHIISTFDQRNASSIEEIKKELVHNLTEKINWHRTMIVLLEKDVKEFYECGAGKDLSKIARFIEGDFKVISIQKV